MTAERSRQLENVGFDCGTRKIDLGSLWRFRFQQLLEFFLQFGHCFVPLKYSDDPKLGWWVAKQRKHCRLFHQGKPGPMTAERFRELDGSGLECETTAAFRSEQSVVWIQGATQVLYTDGKSSHITSERVRELESKLALGIKRPRNKRR